MDGRAESESLGFITAAQDASYLNATPKKKNAEAMAKKYGVDVKDPVALKKKLAELNALRERWKNPYSDGALMDEIRNAWRAREGADVPEGAAASVAELPSERLFREYAARGWQTEGVDYSTVYQRDLINTLRGSGKYDAFYDAVDMLQRNGKPHDSQANSPASYAAVADRLRNEVLALSNGEIDLENGSHSVSVSDLWHSYSKHCLDSFIEDGHLNLTHDDLRMIPDIVENYDSVELINAKKGYSLVFTKEYGDVVYVVAETIAGKKETPRGTRQKTIYLNEITKKASSRAFHPTPFSKNFTRTEIVNPVTAFIKQNYAAEARKIAKKMRDSKQGMVAPNGQPSRLSPELWVVTRLQSFKAWFGDWENAPANASKVVDENGEPLVVYHGSLQWFQIFNDGNERHQSGAPDGTIFANDNREIAVSFVDYYGGNAENVILNANDARHARMPWGVYRKGGIYPLFMNLKNPLVVDFEGMTWHGEKYDIKDVNWYAVEARKKGHDGLIIRNVIDVGFTDTNDVPPSTDYVAFESNQVKSATDNRGTFDADSSRIDFSICGLKAKTANEYLEKGADYTDPADGQRKFVIPVSGARLRSDVTPGMVNVAVGGHKDVSLAALLHYPELFRAYPQLADMRVRLYRPAEATNVGGYFSPEAGTQQAAYIAVNVAFRSQMLNTLLHESQHAIQHLEGVAMGAGSFDQLQALAYIDEAIRQRKAAGLNDDWSRDNLAFLERLKGGVEAGDESAISMTYVMSHGEQEAGFTGEGYGKAGANPMDDSSEERLMRTKKIPRIGEDARGRCSLPGQLKNQLLTRPR